MILFIALGSLMVLLCMAFVVVPMWRAARGQTDRRREANVEIYRQRCIEIDREVAAARIEPVDAQNEKDELGARLLADIDARPSVAHALALPTGSVESAESPRPAARRRSRPWLASLIAVVLISVSGIGGYYWLGDWEAVDNQGMPNFDQMMGELQADLAAHPGDRGARLMLAQAQQSAGQYDQAAQNLHVLNTQVSPPNPDLLAAEAQARIAAGEDLTGTPGNLYAQVLSVDPANSQALWYMGLRASETGDNKQAVAYWDTLLKQNLPPQARAMVVSRRNALAGDKPKL